MASDVVPINDVPFIEHNEGDRVMVNATNEITYISQSGFYDDGDVNYRCENGGIYDQSSLTAMYLPNIPWSEVEEMIRRKMRQVQDRTLACDIGRVTVSIDASYNANSEIDFKFETNVDYGNTATASTLDAALEESIRQYGWNEANKPKALPRR
jgi:hypothetical protein